MGRRLAPSPGVIPLARISTLVVFAVLLGSPGPLAAQAVSVHGSGGPTLRDSGYSLAAGVGFSPTSKVTLMFGYDQTHLSSWTRSDGRSTASFRGGTLFQGTIEVQVAPLGRARLGPYGLAGVAAGRSKLNVNAVFPDPITNDVRAAFVGGGVHVPVRDRLSLFADARFMIGAEGIGGIVAVAPLRAGISWTF
jgi:opacity protein-like surface antigen